MIKFIALRHMEKVADAAAAGSIGVTTISWWAQFEPAVTVLAGVVAIVTGVAATVFHVLGSIERARNLKKKEEDE